MAYEQNRPHLPAETKRLIMTEAGHRCSVQHCNEHIVEVHHIDENRENNAPANLIVLCDKHHKLAHQGVISRMDQRKYKELLTQPAVATTNTRSDHDRKLLQQINDIFPFETIQMIKSESFGKFVKREVIDPFFELLHYASDPLFRFTDQNLECLKQDVIRKAELFNRHFSQQSGGLISGYDYIDLNEIRRRNPNADIEYWVQYSYETVRLAQDFCTTMLLLRAELANQ
ncbi:HNH endonuclease signature motif containing protein [Photobacterium damselae]|uniref:HNH endonuclease signature motif containing protein n=1 Tax=Photobacterium damselae TaxID=38293 RepID=UPI001EE07EF6|nr:HNH endonuclease signature motif containing protein [Photobacterium damselae]MCG3845474.1 HNH endonuclease [Photobacterium damselae]